MSIYHVTTSGGGGTSIDRTSFVGHNVPVEVKRMIKHVDNLEKAHFRKFLQVLVNDFEGKKVTYEDYVSLVVNPLTDETTGLVYAGLHRLLQLALRIPVQTLKQQHFQEDLLEMKIPEKFVTDLTSVVFGSRCDTIKEAAVQNRPGLPTLDNLSWRVDASISTSVLNRVLEPTVLLEMTLSNGRVHTFEVPVTKFHELRFNVANLLKEMNEIERKGVFKLQDR